MLDIYDYNTVEAIAAWNSGHAATRIVWDIEDETVLPRSWRPP
jgi:hypothetical protein